MNILRHIPCLLLILLISCSSPTTPDTDSLTLRVSFPYRKSATEYDPARIELAPEYIFLENIFSTLVEISPKGELIPAVASRFEWVDNNAVFTIRKDIQTVDGTPITAEDAAFSRKRLLIKAGDTHAPVRDLLCPDITLVAVDDDCPGIAVDGDNLILKTGGIKTFLFPMLASIDYAVLPRASVDPQSLAIRDYRNTSGPYYVAEDRGSGNIMLRPNTGHFHYRPDIPQEIVLVPSDTADPLGSLKSWQRQQIDFITTVDTVRPEDLIAFARKNPDANLHMTLNIRTMTVAFTSKGIAETSVEQRRAIGNNIRQAFADYVKSRQVEGFTPIEQYFSVFGEAGLTPEDLAVLRENYRKDSLVTVPDNLKMQVVRVGDPQLWRDILDKYLPGTTIERGETLPAFTTYADAEIIPHFIITGPDTGWMEDIGLISYTVNAGYFGIPRAEGHRWIEQYMNTADKEKRLAMLRKLHFQALNDAVLIPFAGAPYVALARSSWRIGLSTFFANNQFWLITHKDDV